VVSQVERCLVVTSENAFIAWVFDVDQPPERRRIVIEARTGMVRTVAWIQGT
jgi:hypothetical protein